MPKVKKNFKQVSLEFKHLSAEVTSQIESLDKEASQQLNGEREDEDEDCKIISSEPHETSKQNIYRYFMPLKTARVEAMKEVKVCATRCDDESREESVESENSCEDDDDEENDSSDESSDSDDVVEVKDGDEKAGKDDEVPTEKESGQEAAEGTDAEKTKKKRRPPHVVQAERLQKELEKARRRIEREAARRERLAEQERLKLEKKNQKEKLAAEREATRLQAEKEKEEKRQKREEARRERERLKEEERLKKEEERRRKDEDKLQVELAKKEKEEAKKMELEEEQRRKEKQASFFSNFFIKSNAVEGQTEEEARVRESTSIPKKEPFVQFHVKKGMRLPRRRHASGELRLVVKKLDDVLTNEKHVRMQDLYVSELRSGRRKPMSAGSTWPMDTRQQEVQYLGTGSDSALPLRWYKAKLLQFAENHRPPFYGTFRRRSRAISARNPFRKDGSLLDYDVDSDEEWEEDEPGESLSHSENEDEDEEGQDEENDGFFVPHGYLSEDEGADDDDDRLTPEMRKIQQQLSEARFEASMKKKIQPLVNVIVPPSVDPSQHPLLSSFKVIELTEAFTIPISISVQTAPSSGRTASKNGVPDEAMGDIVRLVHANKLRLKKIVFEFRMYWEHKLTDRLPAVTYEEDLKGRDWKEFSISKNQLEKRIREIAKWEDNCWRVGPETLSQYPADEVNSWEYVTNVPDIVRRKRQSSPRHPPPPVLPEVARDASPEREAETEEKDNEVNPPKATPQKPIYSFFKEEKDGQPASDKTPDKPAVRKKQAAELKAKEDVSAAVSKTGNKAVNAKSDSVQKNSAKSAAVAKKAAAKQAKTAAVASTASSSSEKSNKAVKKAKPVKKVPVEKEGPGQSETESPEGSTPSTPKNSLKKESKTPPSALKEAARKEAMQKLKAELLKEKCKVVTNVPEPIVIKHVAPKKKGTQKAAESATEAAPGVLKERSEDQKASSKPAKKAPAAKQKPAPTKHDSGAKDEAGKPGGKVGRPPKRANSEKKSKPMKVKIPLKKTKLDKENSEDDCDIIDLCD